MKKFIPVALLLLALSGCDKKPKEEAAKGLNPGFIHFASILVLDDLITNGINSGFVSLSPVPIVNPDDTVTADAVVEDFRRDFVDAQDKYPLKLSEGLSITWNLDHNADAQYGMSFHKEERTKSAVFAGKLSLRFDPEYYSATPYPTYSRDSDVTVICREFTSATERKNDYLLWVEVAFDKCMTATDYYASVRNQLKNQQNQLKERLNNVFAGNEEVSEDVAQKLVAYYQAGNAFAPDSVCLTGSREACLSSLKTEIVRKHEDAKIGDLESIKVRPEGKEPAKKPETGAKPAEDKPKPDIVVVKPPEQAQQQPAGETATQQAGKAAAPPETAPENAAATAPAAQPQDKPGQTQQTGEKPGEQPAAPATPSPAESKP